MKCPNHEECEINFVGEEYDNGDPSTPYFESYYVYVYDELTSLHHPDCPPLTDKQIEDLEYHRNLEPSDDKDHYMGLD